MNTKIPFLGLIVATLLSGCGTLQQPETPPAKEGLPRLTFREDSSLSPVAEKIPDRFGDGPRRLARIAEAGGAAADFVDNELLVAAQDARELDALVARWNGRVLATVDPAQAGLVGVPAIYLVRVEASGASTARLASDVQSVAMLGGDYRVSSEAGWKLLALAARETANGARLGLNWVLHPHDIPQRTTIEAAAGPAGWNPDAFTWPYMSIGSAQDIGVGEAWFALYGRSSPVRIAVIDCGFAANLDFPPGVVMESVFGTPSSNSRCPSIATADPFHGTHVVDTLMGLYNNQAGAAGPASEFALPFLFDTGLPDQFDLIRALTNALQAFGEGPGIINISAGVGIPAVGAIFAGPLLDVITGSVRAGGTLIFASAGNAPLGQPAVDVDAEDSFGPFRWERTMFIPCEAMGVLCIGGLDWDSRQIHARSYYGSKSGREATSVDLFAPYTVYVSSDPGDPPPPPPASTYAKTFNGTSAASPFAAGVASLIWSAEPSLTADQVERILLATAHVGTAPGEAPRWVNARDAVARVLPPPPSVDRGRFRVSVDGLLCQRPTRDNLLQLDGVDDEVFVMADLSLFQRTSDIHQPSVQSLVMGDTNNHPGRIRAGSGHNLFGGNGGFREGDSFSMSMFVWEGELISDQTTLVVLPSLWEWDDNPRLLSAPWVQSLADAWASIGPAVDRITLSGEGPDPGPALRDELRRAFNPVFIRHGNDEADRPIGMDDRGSGRYGYLPTALVLTYDAAARIAGTDVGRGPGVVEMRFRENDDLRGDYTLLLRIESVP